MKWTNSVLKVLLAILTIVVMAPSALAGTTPKCEPTGDGKLKTFTVDVGDGQEVVFFGGWLKYSGEESGNGPWHLLLPGPGTFTAEVASGGNCVGNVGEVLAHVQSEWCKNCAAWTPTGVSLPAPAAPGPGATPVPARTPVPRMKPWNRFPPAGTWDTRDWDTQFCRDYQQTLEAKFGLLAGEILEGEVAAFDGWALFGIPEGFRNFTDPDTGTTMSLPGSFTFGGGWLVIIDEPGDVSMVAYSGAMCIGPQEIVGPHRRQSCPKCLELIP